ncbi:MAG: PIN domain-containing protein [Chloroflexota bacterium]
MNITRETSLFFDASVLVAGAHSPQGGSALLLAACARGGFRAQMSFAVLMETLHALDEFPRQSRRAFECLLREIDWEFLAVPPEEVLARYEQYIDTKDVHVLAAAVEGGAEFLLTLDRRHILAVVDGVREEGLDINILRPGDFIRGYYPQHEDYVHLPSPRAGDLRRPGQRESRDEQ